jgi:hypothetical protein
MLDLKLYAIPAQLRDRRQWLVWKLETRKGKPSKVPYAATGGHGKSNDPQTWCDFFSAAKAVREAHYDGIGFAFAEGDGLVGIDLDHVITLETGEVDPRASEILERFAGTYAEISPSGTGLRIFCHGTPGRTGKNEGSPKWAEIYDYTSPRYLTVTGHHWPGTAETITAQQSALDWLHQQFFFRPNPATTPPRTPSIIGPQQGANSLPLTDQELIRRIEQSRSGGKFRALMSGSLDGHGGDHSAADLALCSLLAWWTGKDPAVMDRIFRTSGLMRDKWDKVHGGSTGKTYGGMTIDRAIASCTGHFDPTPRVKGQSGTKPAPESPTSYGADQPPEGGGVDEDGPDDRPEIRIGGDRLIGAMQEAERVLFHGKDNEPPFFTRGGLLMRINRVTKRRERKGESADIPNALAMEPVTSEWMRVRMMRSCKFLGPRKGPDGSTVWAPVNLPSEYPASYCAWGLGEWWAPDLRAVVEAPVLLANGTIISKSGFDPKSRLYLDGRENWKLPPARKKGEVIDPLTDKAIRSAVELFEDLFYGPERFSPETPADFSAMVAAVLTALVKTEIGAAPGFVVTAPIWGSGKGKFADIVSIIKSGRRVAMMAMPTDKKGNQDEVKFQDKLFSALLDGDGMIVVDEVQRSVDSPTLRTMLTQEEYKDRVKGISKMATVRPVDCLYMVLGNNLTVAADDSRRWIRVYLNPKCSDPHKRTFTRDAIQHAIDNRIEIVQAALTLMHSYMMAGMPDQGCKLGSYERWAALVPSCLVWAGLLDPCDTMAAWLASDPDRQILGGLLEVWSTRWGDKAITVNDVVKEFDERPNAPENGELREFLTQNWGEKKGVNSRRLGNYISARVERRLDGMWFVKDGEKARAIKWRVAKE